MIDPKASIPTGLSEEEETLACRRALGGAWNAFFARFGRLTEAQRRAIPLILENRNVLVVAPTASGKTEAVVAPVATQMLARGVRGLNVLYVSPTRALANDILSRLEGPLADLSIKARLKHGDSPYLPVELPNWLITTPESLDSMICRRPEYFAQLHTVVVDEIHLLDSTYRGDQMRMLLLRLRLLSHAPIVNTHLLSATLMRPAETAARYADDCEAVEVTGSRGINQYYVQDTKQALELAQERGWRKLLVFCNKRQDVEECAAEFKGLDSRLQVVAHHGKLSRSLREDAEEVMRTQRSAICVATSTLEIGIDIGDIDAVLLAKPPFGVSSLMQRIGRGNRRTGTIEAVCVAVGAEEESLLRQMFLSAEAGDYQSPEYFPDLSVAIQQTFSLLFQFRQGVKIEELTDRLALLAPAQTIEMILAHLVDMDYLLFRGSRYFASSKTMDEAEKGKIHVNIPDDGDTEVFDVLTNRRVGRISKPFSKTFLLGGNSWEFQRLSSRGVEAKRHGRGANPAFFTPTRDVGRWFPLLPPVLRVPKS